VNTIRQRILVLAVAVALLSPALLSEQSQKASRTTQEDRIKRLEERADTAEKAASAAAMEKDYIVRTQRLYETYYEKTYNTQLWTLAMVGLLLTALFGLVARFSLNLFEQRTKLAVADATAQMRNDHSRILAKEVQKLWDSNAADNKKLKEGLTAQIMELDLKLKDRSNFQTQLVQGLLAAAGQRLDHSIVTFCQALRAYKSGKQRDLIEKDLGATTIKLIFESLQKMHSENYVDKAREELADPLYNGLDEELALAALHLPWLTPLINERIPAAPEPAPTPEPAAEPRPAAPSLQLQSSEPEWASDEESSCRLITT
jgi:hypothetical protein